MEERESQVRGLPLLSPSTPETLTWSFQELYWKGDGKVMERRGDYLCCHLQLWNATEV